ncbi:MAG TPA: hypothetical protein VM433_13745 [Mycobacteriales bacterium]|nr:hypothetical protein [Mycobacteriales bacterium]
MGTVHCPLCGLRYRHGSELDEHAREAHAPASPPESRETLVVPRRRPPRENVIDQVLHRR